MSDKSKVKKREPGFFIIDNEILEDFKLGAYTELYYMWLCKYAFSGIGFISKSKLAKRYKVSRNRFIKAEKLLIEKKLIKNIGYTDYYNIPIFEILKVKKKKKKKRPVLHREQGCSTTEQGAVP